MLHITNVLAIIELDQNGRSTDQPKILTVEAYPFVINCIVDLNNPNLDYAAFSLSFQPLDGTYEIFSSMYARAALGISLWSTKCFGTPIVTVTRVPRDSAVHDILVEQDLRN